MKKQMYLDVSKKVGDPTAVKTGEAVIRELEAKLEAQKNSYLKCIDSQNAKLDDLEAKLAKDYETREELVKFCIKYFSLNLSAVSGEHIPKLEKFKKELKAFMDAR